VNQFFAAYDAVLARWPVLYEAVDVSTEFGTSRVQVCGPPDGGPLLLLPGGGATSTVWFANVEALGRSHRVFAVDVVGDAGRSVPNVRNGRSLRTGGDLMSWLSEVIDGCGLESVSLCGHSYGGRIALAYALHAPHRVRRLVLLDPTACFAGMSLRYLWHALPLLLRPSEQRLRALFGWELGGAGALDAQWLNLAAAGAAEFRTKIVVPRRPSRERLRGLAVPTLLLLAGRSRVHNVDRVAANARLLLPDVTVDVLPHVSHHGLPMLDADRLNSRMIEFLG
jgi:pimeloyl-ACP methyl ester carboxylesterase